VQASGECDARVLWTSSSLSSLRCQPALVRRPWGRHCVGGSNSAVPLLRAVRPRAVPTAEEGGSQRVRAHPRARERHRRLRPRGGWLDAPVCVLLNCTGIRMVCTPAHGQLLATAPRSTFAIQQWLLGSEICHGNTRITLARCKIFVRSNRSTQMPNLLPGEKTIFWYVLAGGVPSIRPFQTKACHEQFCKYFTAVYIE
jgi:hypothetical protein